MQRPQAKTAMRTFLICASIALVIHALTGDWVGYLSYVLFLGSTLAILSSRPFTWASQQLPFPPWITYLTVALLCLIVWRIVLRYLS